MPQIQGVQGRSRSCLLRALGNEGDGVSSTFPTGKQNGDFFNEGDGVSSTFPTGKQNGDFFQKLYLTDGKIIKWQLRL
jgi:hypothetical protein